MILKSVLLSWQKFFSLPLALYFINFLITNGGLLARLLIDNEPSTYLHKASRLEVDVQVAVLLHWTTGFKT